MTERRHSVLLLFLGDPTRDRRVQSFHKLFRQKGYDVTLMAGLQEGCEATGIRTIEISAPRGPRRFMQYDRKLRQTLKSIRCSIVVACDLYSLSAASALKRSGRARVLLYDAREVYTELPTVSKKPLSKFVWKRVEANGLSVTDRIVVTAPHDLQAICDVHDFLPRSRLIRNLPWKNRIVKDRTLLRSLGIAENEEVLVYVGGLQLGRGLEILIRALPANCHLLIIGDGILRSKLEQLVAEMSLTKQVTFTGSLPSKSAQALVAACDVGISLIEPLSKSYELALPSKIFEYMQAGLPVVSSKLRHVEEIFDGEDWIKFVTLTDIKEIESGLLRAIASSKDAIQCKREQDLAYDLFHFEKDAEKLVADLHELLA